MLHANFKIPSYYLFQCTVRKCLTFDLVKVETLIFYDELLEVSKYLCF